MTPSPCAVALILAHTCLLWEAIAPPLALACTSHPECGTTWTHETHVHRNKTGEGLGSTWKLLFWVSGLILLSSRGIILTVWGIMFVECTWHVIAKTTASFWISHLRRFYRTLSSHKATVPSALLQWQGSPLIQRAVWSCFDPSCPIIQSDGRAAVRSLPVATGPSRESSGKKMQLVISGWAKKKKKNTLAITVWGGNIEGRT